MSETFDKKSFFEKLREKIASWFKKPAPKGRQLRVLARMAFERSSRFGSMTTIDNTPDGSFDNIQKWHKIASVDAFRKKFDIRIVDEIKRICFLMHLPQNTQEMAISIYRKARVAKVTNGRRYQWIAAASVYAACRVSGFSRSLEEFAEAAQLQPKNIGRTYLAMKRALKFGVETMRPVEQIHRIALVVGIPHETEDIAVKLLENQSYGGKPTTIAATALYLASVAKGGQYTQSQLAKAAGINENSIRNCYQQFKVEMAIPA